VYGVIQRPAKRSKIKVIVKIIRNFILLYPLFTGTYTIHHKNDVPKKIIQFQKKIPCQY
jgi:hypothetical protein